MKNFSFYLFLSAIITTFTTVVSGQNIKSDLFIVLNNEANLITKNTYYLGENNSQKVMRTKSVIQKINPLYYTAKAAMFLYQNAISQQLSKDCPYEVTCSNFCKKAIEKKGLLIGVLFGADRLMRCNPFSFLGEEKNIEINKNNKIVDPLFTF